MTKKKRSIAIGADHRGYAMKEFLKKHTEFDTTTIEWHDVGALDDERSDYPTYGMRAVAAMHKKVSDSAVLICGSGIGMAITANRYPGIYAGVVWNADIAAIAKEHDHVNVLVFPSDYVSNEDALKMLQAWLVAKKKDGRYEKRLAMIEEIVI